MPDERREEMKVFLPIAVALCLLFAGCAREEGPCEFQTLSLSIFKPTEDDLHPMFKVGSSGMAMNQDELLTCMSREGWHPAFFNPDGQIVFRRLQSGRPPTKIERFPVPKVP